MTHATAALPPQRQIRDLFSSHGLWGACLHVEATLAEVEAELNMIPAEAAREIRRKASLAYVHEESLAADVARTRAPIMSLVRALANACAGDAGGYVHWGATTQNVVQTARTLLMRQSHEAFMLRFSSVLLKLAALAEDGADMLTVGRTNFRHALPITFGFKVAGWIEEFIRHQKRFSDAEPRVFALLWGGAVGAMHAFGDQASEVHYRLARRLNLTPLAVPSRAGNDYVVEYFLVLGLFSATCSKMARELYMLMADEVGEIYERQGKGVVGSSTMPNKVNPKVTVQTLAIAAQLRTLMPLAFEAMQPTHEGDAAANEMLYALIDQACPLAYDLVCSMEELFSCVVLVPERMLSNLEASGQAIAAESAMMTLAPNLGRARAYEVVKDAIGVSEQRRCTLLEALRENEVVRAVMGVEKLRSALEPGAYTGRSGAMAREMGAAARRAAALAAVRDTES